MSGWTKSKRSAAAKKAAHTRKAKRKKGVTSAVAKRAKAAGTLAERRFVAQLKKRKNLVLNGKGIPDIIAHGKNGWEFFEIKPYKKRHGYSSSDSWYIASEKSRSLNSNQRKKFKELVLKGQHVSMVYYNRKRRGSKTKPTYSFEYERVRLQKRHFKSRKGPDPADLLP